MWGIRGCRPGATGVARGFGRIAGFGVAACVVGLGCGGADGAVDETSGSTSSGASSTVTATAGSGSSSGGPGSSGTGSGTASSGPDGGTPSTDVGPDFDCPQDGVRGRGTHRVFAQGSRADPDDEGIYPFLHEWTVDGADALLCDDSVFVDDTNGDGVWQPDEIPHKLGPMALVHGEHYLVGAGAFVEFTITLCDDITGNVALYIPNYDEPGSEALHQLFVVHEGEEFLIAETIDTEAGMSGYNPFIRVLEGEDPDAVPGDLLKLRTTNLNGIPFSVMVFTPPSQYESWVLVEVL